MSRQKTLTNLISEASSLVDDTFDNAQWVQWFNNAMDDMADVIKLDNEVTLSPVEGASNTFALPEDYISAITVTLPSGLELSSVSKRDMTSVGYKIKMGNIVLQGMSATEISLYYYRRPLYASTSSNDPVDVPDDCVRAVVYFACAQAMLREDETERYKNFVDEYTNAKVIAKTAQQDKQSCGSGAWTVVR